MAKRLNAWYDRKWLMPTLAILTWVSTPFGEDIREAARALIGVVWADRLFDSLLAVGALGLVFVLVLTSNRATRTCENLQRHMQKDLAAHRDQLVQDLANHQTQLQEDLAAVVESKLKPITDGLATLQSNVSALGSRVDALDSRISALKDQLSLLYNKTT